MLLKQPFPVDPVVPVVVRPFMFGGQIGMKF